MISLSFPDAFHRDQFWRYIHRTQRFFDSTRLASLPIPRLFAKINFCKLSPRSIALFMTRVSVLFAQDSENELPECADRSEVCSKVDLYGVPWVERQCRCPNGRACPSSLHGDDGHTIIDKTRRYKLCEPVKRLPICRYFKWVRSRHVFSPIVICIVVRVFSSTWHLLYTFL